MTKEKPKISQLQLRDLSDEEIVAQCQRELPIKHNAYTELIRRYQSYGYQLALRYVKNPEDAKDILQEAFLRVYFHIQKFRGESSFKTWFSQIVINLSLTYRLTNSRRGRFYLDENNELNLEYLKQSLVSRTSEFRFWKVLGDILRRMKQEYRKAFILRYFKNRPLQYIAQKLKTSLNGAKMKISRAKKQFFSIYNKLFQ